ncbi:MAG: WD40 repeat domain-containing protein [Armatimonadetes bacterium]|nr:WD40 repeat domain-containing protein [Armatimonadota bacterium]
MNRFLVLFVLLLAAVAVRAAPAPLGATAAVYADETLILGHQDGTVSLGNGTKARVFGERMPISWIAVQPRGDLLACASREGVALISGASGKVLMRMASARSPLAFTADGRTLLTTLESGRGIQRWRVPPNGQATVLGTDLRIGRVWDISPDGTLVAAAKGEWEIRLWSVAAARSLRVIKNGGLWGGITNVRFSQDGRVVLLMGSTISKPPDGVVWPYDTSTGKELGYCTVGNNTTNAAVSPDRALVAAVGVLEGEAALSVSSLGGGYKWGQNVFTQENRVPFGVSPVVTFSPDSKTLVTAGSGQPTRLWDAQSGALKGTL